MSKSSTVGIGLIGAGTFARKAHVPSFKALSHLFRVVAVCSRTRQSAEELAAMFESPVDVCDDVAALLARPDVEAVDIILPIPLLPAMIERCLAAGKHVISEKPIAPTVAEGQALLEQYAHHPDQVWMVGENWRYDQAFQAAGQVIRDGIIGRPMLCEWSLQLPIMPGSPGHRTTWRRTGDFPGGFLIDGGVHHVAGLRMVLGEIESVTATVAAHRPDLPPADTLSATLRFANGAVGSYSVSYAARSGLAESSLHVVGSEGSLRVAADTLTLWTVNDETSTRTFPPHQSVERELVAFGEAIRSGASHCNTPKEGLRDLAVIEAMLTAAEQGERQPVPQF
jgi:predicted dehydrogenase